MQRNRSIPLGKAVLILAAATCLSAFQSVSNPWLPVDHTPFRSHLASLSAEERTEQLRDWALIAASMDAEPENKAPGDTLSSVQPLRIDALHNMTQKRVGATRWLSLSNNRILALIAEATPEPLQVLGRIADEYRVESSAPPRDVLVYDYRLDDKTSELAIRKDRVVPGAALYEPAAGYHEEDVRTLADLQKFLARNLDLVLFHEASDHIRVGGRVFAAHPAQLIQAEDLATIFRAGAGLSDMVRSELERRGLRERYESRVNDAVSDFLKEKSSLLTTYSDFETLRQQIYREVPYEDFLKRQVDAVLKANPPGLGFSLDPRTNFDQIAKDLKDAAAGKDAFFKWLMPIEIADLKLESKSYANTFSELMAKFAKEESARKPEVDDRETSLESLIGFVTARANAPEAPKVESRGSTEQFTTQDIEDDAREVVDGVREAAKAKSAELTRIADALTKKDITPLLDFKRYLEADIVGITIRAGAPKYRILDLQQMLKDNDMDVVVDGVYGPKTGALIKSFQEKHQLKTTGIVDVETWKALLKSSPDKKQELGFLHELLQQLEEHRDYQCARYDGRFAGTEVGMTLYYTDLVMKLWSFANKDQTPMVPGFVPEAQYHIADIYKNNILQHPSTRGWLSGRLEAMGFHDAGSTLHFAPTSTRLYNASSSYLFPGAEVPANFAAERFSSWWNNHYAEVADYEPQYHRLNQLMKWETILESKKQALPAPLAALDTVVVPNAGHFDQWWARHKELKVQETVPFLKVAGESTECIAIVTSEPFRAFGGLYSLSGGVSLPKAEELAAKAATDLKRGEAPVRPSVGPGGTVAFELPKDQRLEGQSSAVAGTKVDTQFQAKPNGVAISAKLGTAALGSVEFTRLGTGFRISGEEAPQIAAARHLTSPSAEEKWTKVTISSDEFLLISPEGKPARVVSAPKGEVGAGAIRVDAGGPKDVSPIAPADLEKAVGDGKWLAMGALDLLGRDPGVRLTASLPEDTRRFTASVSGKQVSARVSKSGMYFERRAGSFDQSLDDLRTLNSLLDRTELQAIIRAGQRKGATQFARRNSKGDLVLAGFGGGNDGVPPPVSSAFFDDMIPRDGKFIRGIFVGDDSRAPLKVAEGLIELPAGASDEVRQSARRLSKVTEAKPEVGERIQKLAGIGPEDLAFFENHRGARGANYIEFKAVPTEALGSTVLADFQFTAEEPEVIVRQGDRISIIPVAHPAEAIASRILVDGVAKGARKDLKVADLRTGSRAYYEVLDSVQKTTGGKRFLTKEDGEINAETVYRIGGGDPNVLFPRDIADVTVSLKHADEKVALSVSESVVASTVALDDPKLPAAAKIATLLDSLLARVEAPVSYEDFLRILEDDEKQITLIARYRDGGLVFSNRWVGLKEIESDLEGDEPKDLLHLITNGGQDVVNAFADSGIFKRVVLTRFTSGDQPSFDRALWTLSTVFSGFALPLAALSADDWKELKADAGDLATVLDAAAKPAGDKVEADVSTLMAKGRERHFDWRSYSGQSILGMLRLALRSKQDNDADRVFESVNADILKTMRNDVDRPAAAALQGVTQLKHD